MVSHLFADKVNIDSFDSGEFSGFKSVWPIEFF